ncbi:MAG: exodeoxyribonuclease VII large subunit [Colwelliaceae bacterium]|nr:exodeoxyribonuclease VII large subunit [Colwelliaceae bacterium]
MTTKQHVLQVSELTRKVRYILESEINTIWLTGEISNFIAASSGHWYLSLKDSKSQVKCAMFKGNNRYTRIKPQNGQQVLVKAKVSLYEPRGDFQLIIEQMEDAGEGLLRQQYEALKAQLTKEGLFLQENKQALASSYQKVGVVTSPTGAAIKDIISVLKRRSPSTQVVIYPALVQGELAAQDIASSIEIANQRDEVDILIVGRGGGSLEDLWCFNDERVVRSIYYSRLPVISAVGHEIDTTLSDYAADVRAPTPSAAAELISGDIEDQTSKVQQYDKRLAGALLNQQQRRSTHLKHLAARLQQCEPQRQLQSYSQLADDLERRLQQAMQRYLSQQKARPQYLAKALKHLSPEVKLRSYEKTFNSLSERLTQAAGKQLESKQQSFARRLEQLQLVSPLATIARGYSIVRDKDNGIIRSVSQVEDSSQISVQVNDGVIEAKVTAVSNKID